jgi:hypothetical protein
MMNNSALAAPTNTKLLTDYTPKETNLRASLRDASLSSHPLPALKGRPKIKNAAMRLLFSEQIKQIRFVKSVKSQASPFFEDIPMNSRMSICIKGYRTVKMKRLMKESEP